MNIQQIELEIILAQAELNLARQDFDYANPEFVEIATLKLKAAEGKLDTLYSIIKMLKAIA